MTRLTGTPLELDTVLRPLARGVLGAVGATSSLLLTLLGWMWVAPLPLAAAVVLYQVLFWHRGDRPVVLELDAQLRFTDPVRGSELTVDPATLTAVVVHVRPHLRTPEFDVHVQLTNQDGVCFAVRMRSDTRPEPGPGIVDGEAMDLVVGGWSRAVRDLAHADALCRQIVRDRHGALLAWLRERADPACFGRVPLRLWEGREPDLDLLGHLEGAPTRTVVVSPKVLRAPVTLGTAERTAELLRWREEKQVTSGAVPLLLVDLAETGTVAFPSGLAGTLAEARELTEATQHTQLVEGQALVWHLLYGRPSTEWPEALGRAVDDAQGTTGLDPARISGPPA